MNDKLLMIIGFIPAVIYPVAGSVQLVKIIRSKDAEGVSPLSWILFGIANACLFIYVQKYTDLFTIIALLGTACINFTVAGLALRFRTKR